MNNAGESSSRQALNPAWLELRQRMDIAAKACSRWIRRLENTRSRFPDPVAEATQIAASESQAQAVLRQGRKPAGLSHMDIELWSNEGPRTVRLELDPARTAHDQAKDWIAQVRKKRRGLAVAESRRALVEQEHAQAVEWAERLAGWQGLGETWSKSEIRARQAELDGLVARLLPRGLWPQPPRTRDQEVPNGPIRWVLADGWILLAGRSGTENDLLTQRIALAHDLWFHAAHVPGAHVILRSPNGKPATVPPELLETAAGVAAWLSKLRSQDLAEVHVTEKRHVRKPRKAPPGTVVLEHSRTLRVKPVPPPRDQPI